MEEKFLCRNIQIESAFRLITHWILLPHAVPLKKNKIKLCLAVEGEGAWMRDISVEENLF